MSFSGSRFLIAVFLIAIGGGVLILGYFNATIVILLPGGAWGRPARTIFNPTIGSDQISQSPYPLATPYRSLTKRR